MRRLRAFPYVPQQDLGAACSHFPSRYLLRNSTLELTFKLQIKPNLRQNRAWPDLRTRSPLSLQGLITSPFTNEGHGCVTVRDLKANHRVVINRTGQAPTTTKRGPGKISSSQSLARRPFLRPKRHHFLGQSATTSTTPHQQRHQLANAMHGSTPSFRLHPTPGQHGIRQELWFP